MKHIIKFEFFGRKMKIEITASTKELAIKQLQQRINIIEHTTTLETNPFDDIFGDIFKNFKL